MKYDIVSTEVIPARGAPPGGLCVRGQRPPSLLVLAEYWQALKPEVEIDVIFLLQEVQIFLNSKSESYT